MKVNNTRMAGAGRAAARVIVSFPYVTLVGHTVPGPQIMPEKAEDHPYRTFEHNGWERAAGVYAGTFENTTRLFADELLNAVGVRPGLQMVDVACGAGFLAARAAAAGAIATGVDFSESMIEQARRLHPEVTFHCADAESLPFAESSMDAVVISFGLHHFPFPVRALLEARRVLRSGGRLAFAVWSTPDEHALHRIAINSARAVGSAAAALPNPPGGAINEIATCAELLTQAGFNHDDQQFRKVGAELQLGSTGQLVDMLAQGTLRMATLLNNGSPEQVTAIHREVERQASQFQRGGVLHIPLRAILAVARKG